LVRKICTKIFSSHPCPKKKLRLSRWWWMMEIETKMSFTTNIKVLKTKWDKEHWHDDYVAETANSMSVMDSGFGHIALLCNQAVSMSKWAHVKLMVKTTFRSHVQIISCENYYHVLLCALCYQIPHNYCFFKHVPI